MRTLHVFAFFLMGTIAGLLQATTWKEAIDAPAQWYLTDEAAQVLEGVLAYQLPGGGWPKNHDMFSLPTAEDLAKLHRSKRQGTIDNKATFSQLEFLSRYVSATGDARARAAAERGFAFLLEAQYDNGGWPMYYPLLGSYHDAITFNDDAMVGVLSLLLDIRKGKDTYDYLDDDLRARLRTALEKGVDCILRSQVIVDGQPTVWCAQHDPVTLAPVAARAFEPASLSGDESAGIVKFLTRLNPPTPEIRRAIEGAVDWMQTHALDGIRIKNIGTDRLIIEDPEAPPIWARFYDLESNRPIFVGRDRKVHYDFAQLEQERRAGYDYHGDWPADIIRKNYAEWRDRWIDEQGNLVLKD